MFSKLILVTLISVAVAAPQHHTAAQFPAGVDPSKCPDFPICDNAALHNQQHSLATPAPSWNHQPQQQWNQQPQQQWNQQPQQQWNQQPQPQWNQQPQKSQWNQPQPSWNPAPYQAPSNHLSRDQQDSDDLSGTGGDKYPAGVNPKSCPNYPYCDGPASHDAAVAAPPRATDYSERQYPAGVSPHTCPNFPYCN